jgi:hypothetical protein
MKRLMMAAALAAGLLLVHSLDAAAQNWEPKMQNGGLICGYFPTFSFAAVHNYNNAARSLCRWKCVYKTASGQVHVNAGARNLGRGEIAGLNQTKKDISGIVAKVDGVGSCVEAKDPRRK